MKVIIVGGGRVGMILAKSLLELGHNVTIIEQDYKACQELLSAFDTTVLNGDALDTKILEEANIKKADVLVAATGEAHKNAMVALYAKNKGVKRVIARVSDKEYISLLKEMGIECEYVEASAAYDIELRIVRPIIRELINMDIGELTMIEVPIQPGSSFAQKEFSKLPEHAGEHRVVSVYRAGNFSIPTQDFLIKENDTLLIICRKDAIRKILKTFEIK